MPSHVVAARVSPFLHARLTERAGECGTSLSAYAARVLAASVDAAAAGGPRVDGPLVAAVLRAVDGAAGDSADAPPSRQVDRELCVLLARVIDRREPGYLSAIAPLRRALDAAVREPADPELGALLASLFRP